LNKAVDKLHLKPHAALIQRIRLGHEPESSFFRLSFGLVSEEQGEMFRQDVKEMERRYQDGGT
jgi:hypothetical protein